MQNNAPSLTMCVQVLVSVLPEMVYLSYAFKISISYMSLLEASGIINCDDRMTIFADGVQVGKDNGKWFMSKIYKFPATTQVIAIEGVNGGGPAGIIGSFSSGLVTDESWRCSNKLAPNWNKADFDDSSWPGAVPVSRKDNLKGPKIAKEAKWIWTGDIAGDLKVYCRAQLGRRNHGNDNYGALCS